MELLRKFAELFNDFRLAYGGILPKDQWINISSEPFTNGVSVLINANGHILAQFYGMYYNSDTSSLSVQLTCESLDCIYDMCVADINLWIDQNPMSVNDMTQAKISKLETEIEQLKSQLQ